MKNNGGFGIIEIILILTILILLVLIFRTVLVGIIAQIIRNLTYRRLVVKLWHFISAMAKKSKCKSNDRQIYYRWR